MIITKRADELKPGDVIFAGINSAPRAVLNAIAAIDKTINLVTAALHVELPNIIATNHASGYTFDVEVPDPKVSDENLADLIKAARAWLGGSVPTITERDLIGRLVDTLSPPNPPTYEELLAAVKDFTDPPRATIDGHPNNFTKGLALVDRARKAGLL
jgi:hypothetical protein